MLPFTPSVTAEGYAASGALVVVVLDRVFSFLRSQRAPNGKEHAMVVAKLDELLKDTAAIRSHNHTIINHLAGLQPSVAILLSKLEKR